MMKRWAAIWIIALGVVLYSDAQALNYGAGTYGTCTYGTCGITVASASTVSLPVTPDPSQTRCTVDQDTVSVTTGASVGYTMTLSANSTTTTLAGAVNGGSITAVSASYATPAQLAANTWGYRIDSTGSFGSGPTAEVTSAAVPSLDFAPIVSNVSPQTIVTTSEPAAPSVTEVWYGVCVDMSIPADTYSREVIYTAMTN